MLSKKETAVLKPNQFTIGDKTYEMPCWVEEVPNRVYHGDHLSEQKFIGHSGLVSLGISPAHFKAYQQKGSTAAMEFGSAAHVVMLEEYKDKLAVCQETKRDGSVMDYWSEKARNWRDKKIGEGYDAVVLQKELEQMLAMKEVLYRHPVAKNLLIRGIPERSGFDVHKRYEGIKCKIRADYYIDDGYMFAIVDYKTTGDASQEGFSKTSYDWGYDIQADFYREITYLIEGRWPDFYFIAQEKEPPYAVNVFLANHPDYKDVDKFKFDRNGNPTYEGMIMDSYPQIINFMRIGRIRSNIGLLTYWECIENPQLFERAYRPKILEITTPGYIYSKYLIE